MSYAKTGDPVSSWRTVASLDANVTAKDAVRVVVASMGDEWTDDTLRAALAVRGVAMARNVVARYRRWMEDEGRCVRVGVRPDHTGYRVLHFVTVTP